MPRNQINSPIFHLVMMAQRLNDYPVSLDAPSRISAHRQWSLNAKATQNGLKSGHMPARLHADNTATGVWLASLLASNRAD
jgi:hypothetical protein